MKKVGSCGKDLVWNEMKNQTSLSHRVPQFSFNWKKKEWTGYQCRFGPCMNLSQRLKRVSAKNVPQNLRVDLIIWTAQLYFEMITFHTHQTTKTWRRLTPITVKEVKTDRFRKQSVFVISAKPPKNKLQQRGGIHSGNSWREMALLFADKKSFTRESVPR